MGAQVGDTHFNPPPIFKLMHTIESQQIDAFLSKGPKIPLTYKPMFRLVWSSEMFELRRGTFNVYSGSTLLRTETKTEYVKKYPWKENRWVLEQWFSPEVALNNELPDSINGSFEPIYIFEDASGEALALNLKVVEIILHRLMQPKRSKDRIKSDILKQMLQQELKEDQFVHDVLNDESPLVSQFHDGTAILAPGVKEENKNA